MPRIGNNVTKREVPDKDPQRLFHAYGRECLMQDMANISQIGVTAHYVITTNYDSSTQMV